MRSVKIRVPVDSMVPSSPSITRASLVIVMLALAVHPAATFAPPIIATIRRTNHHQPCLFRQNVPCSLSLYATGSEGDDEDETPENPYADPNYPDLEFVNYSDPEYQVDMGMSDEFYDPSSDTEAQVEAMREERRRRNDEYQFQTYYQKVLRNGQAEFRGEWTVYKTSTFLDGMADGDDAGLPRLVQAGSTPLTVVSRGYKELVETDSPFAVDAERIRHVEETRQPTAMGDAGIDTLMSASSSKTYVEQHAATEKEILGNSYWPESLKAIDFRGHQGIMVCGNAWTICTAVPLLARAVEEETHVGPFADYRAELGIQSDDLRFRVKLHYSVKEDDLTLNAPHPPLRLKSLTVCREALDMWPRMPNAALPTGSLFGTPGAAGGLYDPPPVGSDAQASQYMLIDLEGGASVLFPYLLDQDPEAHNGEGWVTSLDWTPGDIRYQVDRKVNGGPNLLGLRTLELSEVQGAKAEQYRPRDGGQNMRQ